MSTSTTSSRRRGRRIAATTLAAALIGIAGLTACDPEAVPPTDPPVVDEQRAAAERWIAEISPILIGRTTTASVWVDRALTHGPEETARQLAHSATGSRHAVEVIDVDLSLILSNAKLDTWSDRLRDGSSTLDLIATELTDPENLALVGSPDDEGWIDLIYGLLLGRAPTRVETDTALTGLSRGGARGAVVRDLLGSPEGRRATVERVATGAGVDLPAEVLDGLAAHLSCADDQSARVAVALYLHPGAPLR